MICYAAWTAGATNRGALRAAGWGLLLSAGYPCPESEWSARHVGGAGLALDNGAWSAHQAGQPFNEDRYRRAVAESRDLDFVVVPDVVMDADGTRRMADRWLPWTLDNARAPMVLLPVQDGMDDDDLPLGPGIGVFVGGSTEWKEVTIPHWTARAHDAGAWCHVGRVNSQRRLLRCRAFGVDSIDGSGPTRFSKHLEVMERARHGAVQTLLW